METNNLRKLLSNPPTVREGLPIEMRYAIHHRVTVEGSQNSAKSQRQEHRKITAPMCAAAVAVVVVAAGAYALIDRGHHGSIPSVSQTPTVATGLQFRQPAEVVTPNWRVVIVKTLLVTGPKYDILVFDNSKQTVKLHEITYAWGGSKLSAEGQPPKPGDIVGGGMGVPFPNGFSNTPPIKMSWTVNGQDKTELIPLADAKQDLMIQNHHEYHGDSQTWNASYAYDTISGPSFKYPRGVFALHFNGKDMGETVEATIRSSAGSQTLTWTNPPNPDFHFAIDPTKDGFHFDDPKIEVTIQWDGQKETLQMNAVPNQPSS